MKRPHPHMIANLNIRNVLVLVMVGASAGLLAGLFGIGGGTVIVPVLVWCGLSQRQSAASSLEAIIPISIVAVVDYASRGEVNIAISLLLASGLVVGAKIGSILLSKLPELILKWTFVAFLVAVIVEQMRVIPSRQSTIQINPVSGTIMVVVGIMTGIISGVVGIGGGTIMVPAISLLLGAGDLMARGCSLLAMLPGAVSGTFANYRRKLVDIRAGLLIGLAACVTAPVGGGIAAQLNPRTNSLLFASYALILLARSLWVAVRERTETPTNHSKSSQLAIDIPSNQTPNYSNARSNNKKGE